MTMDEIRTLPMAPISTRVAAGKRLTEEAQDDPLIWVLTSDVAKSTGVDSFVKAYPDRFVNVGIAEQTMIGMAAGLATCGKKPFATAFAAIMTLRGCEQIRTDVAYPNLDVKIYATHAGIALGKGGATHQATEDLAILRSMPNMTIVVPCDIYEAEKMISAVVRRPGPTYLRLRRDADPIIHQDDFDFVIGKAIEMHEGNHMTIISCGRLISECLVACDILSQKGIHARLLNMHTVKPIDVAAIKKAARETEFVFTVEDHNILGGLGGAVAEVMAEMGNSAPLYRLGLRDVYAGIGPEEDLLKKHGLSAVKLAETIQTILSHK